MHRSWKMWVGVAISVAALVATLWNVRFGDLGSALSDAEIAWFAPAAVFWIVSFVARAWRWSLLMGGPPVMTTLHAQNIGYLLNSTLPFRLGEVARAYVIGQRTTTSMTRAMSSVVVERVLDLAAVVVMFAAFTQWVPMPSAASRAAMVGAALVVVLVACGGLVVWKAERAEKHVLGPVLRRISPALAARALPKIGEVTAAFRVVGSGKRMALVMFLTLIVWGGNIVFTWLFMRAFLPGTLGQAGLTVVMSNLGGALPSAPGGLGIVQGFAKAALVVPFHLPEDSALAFVLAWSLGQQLLLIVLGAVSLTRIGMTFAQVRAGQLTAG